MSTPNLTLFLLDWWCAVAISGILVLIAMIVLKRVLLKKVEQFEFTMDSTCKLLTVFST